MGQQRADSEHGEVVWSPRLGAHLEAARQRAGMRRVDLALRLGVSEETIRLWERGAVQPTPERLARLIPVLAIEASFWQQEPASAGHADDDLPELARRLRTERTALGLTQAAVAERLGVAQATYAAWETGRARPTARHVDDVAELLGLARETVLALCSTPFVVDYHDWPPLGRLIGARRQALGLTRGGLADAVGVAPGTIASWELGYRTPAAAQVAALAQALETSFDHLTAALPRRRAASARGELILTRLRELGLRSSDLAAAVGTTESTISRWVHGHSRPAPTNLARLASALRLPRAQVIEAAGAAG